MNYTEIKTAVHYRQAFRGNGMSARWDGPITRGHLPLFWWIGIMRDEPRYVVYSYETPIGWVMWNNHVMIPDVEYSAVTRKHQEIVKAYL